MPSCFTKKTQQLYPEQDCHNAVLVGNTRKNYLVDKTDSFTCGALKINVSEKQLKNLNFEKI